MTVKELIETLKEYPQDLPIRVQQQHEDALDIKYASGVNLWVNDTECHATGSSGYEISGEVILKISE